MVVGRKDVSTDKDIVVNKHTSNHKVFLTINY